jgi:tol-pal system protein YbgF
MSSVLGGCVMLSPDQADDLNIKITNTHAYVKRIDDTISSQLYRVADESVKTRVNTEAVLDELRTELQKTQSVVEENTFRLGELSRKLDEIRVNLYRKLGIGQEGATRRIPMPPVIAPPTLVVPPVQTLPVPGGAPVETLPEAVSTTRAVSPQNDYQRAYRDYQKGNYELAKLGFKQYLSTYPGSEDADNAQFWLAQCHYKTGDYATALAETQRLYRSFPASPKIPDAMLIESFIEIERGNQLRAQVLLERLVADFPTTQAAKGAKRKLDSITAGPSD